MGYNDYYLQQINSKLETTNNNLNDIIENQEIMLISGDKLSNEVNKIKTTMVDILVIITAIIIMTCAYYIHHVFDYTWKGEK